MVRAFAILALFAVTSSGLPAAAQDSWPSKPITVMVPFGAGGNTDSLARIYSARLSARLGQQFVIENRVGAGSIIGIMSLASSASRFLVPRRYGQPAIRRCRRCNPSSVGQSAMRGQSVAS